MKTKGMGIALLSAAALLGTTAASFFTISALLWVFQQVPGWGG